MEQAATKLASEIFTMEWLEAHAFCMGVGGFAVSWLILRLQKSGVLVDGDKAKISMKNARLEEKVLHLEERIERFQDRESST